MAYKINKFYVGASHIADAIENKRNDDWTHPTIESAVKHAKEVMEDDDRDMIIIVQIVRVVRRQKRPVIVEKI